MRFPTFFCPVLRTPKCRASMTFPTFWGQNAPKFFEKIRHFGRRGREKRNVEKYDISDIFQAKSEVSNVEKYDISDILQAKSEVSNVE